MRAPISRRTLASLMSMTMLASLAIVTTAAPASAQLTCDGRVATITDNSPGDQDPTLNEIVGTNGPDVIVGTNDVDTIDGRGGRDIICGRGGEDEISGGFGRDRIFGGSGGDTIFGEGGPDDLFGFNGNDLIFGGPGNDFLKGGRGTDFCSQGAGSGPIRQCEKADLKVRVLGPSDHAEGTVTFKVRVKNRGPQAVSYSYELDEENMDATCNGPQPWEKVHTFAKLRPGATRTRSYDVTCTVNDVGAWVEVSAVVFNHGRETKPANNSHKRRTNLFE